MMPRLLCVVLSVVLTALVAGCDNVGRVFDPNINPGGGPGEPGTSEIQVPPFGGDLRDGRPLVRQAYPTGGGWPASVPIVVEFSESVNEASLEPTSPGGTDGRLIVRLQGTEQPIPAGYDFLAGGRLLVLRPTTGLVNNPDPTSGLIPVYEVVLLPEARDVDGVRFQGSEEEILASFTVDAPEQDEDGQILALFPRDNQQDVAREIAIIAVFTRVANVGTLTSANFSLSMDQGEVVPGQLDVPLSVLSIPDSRVVTLLPDEELEPNRVHELTVTSGITFGQQGTLQFNGASPFAEFTTSGVPAPCDVLVGNSTMNFPDKINRANLTNLRMEVDLPADAAVGDQVLARIYGGDREEVENSAALLFVERIAELDMAGVQTVSLDFSGELGSLAQPLLDEGRVTFVTQLRRGSAHSGIVHGSSDARLDTVMPEVLSFGPPASSSGMDVITDLAHLVLYGVANEGLGEAVLTDGINTAQLFAGRQQGEFVMEPLQVGVLTAPRGFSLTVTDTAGNMAAGPATGNIVQRGVITGAVSTSMTVEAYDAATLLPLAGATVVVEPGVPVLPATGRVMATTGADGRVELTGLAAASRTTTVYLAGYDIVTLYDSDVSHASLPLRPIGGAAASLTGSALFQPTIGVTVLVGSGSFEDPMLLAVETDNASPNTIPTTAILANRPTVVTALGGVFEPASTPTFGFHGCNMCGLDLRTPTPPLVGVAAGEESEAGLALLAATVPFIASIPVPIAEDFDLAVGLDTANLVGGGPLVRCTMSMFGFPGQSLFGVGFATPLGGAVFSITGTYSLSLFTVLTPYQSVQWIASEARDVEGRTSRVRAQLTPLTGSVIDLVDPPPIPVVTGPVGAVTGAPLVMVVDAVDPAALPLFRGFLEITAEDVSGRVWTLMAEDQDAAGATDAYQFPDLAGLAALETGDWSILATSRLFIDLFGEVGDFALAERRRSELTFARSAPLTVTVQ